MSNTSELHPCPSPVQINVINVIAVYDIEYCRVARFACLQSLLTIQRSQIEYTEHQQDEVRNIKVKIATMGGYGYIGLSKPVGFA